MSDGGAAASGAAAGGGAAAGAARDTRLGPVGLCFYNLLYWPYLVLSCVLYSVPSLVLFVLTAAFDSKRRVVNTYTTWWGRHYLAWAPFAGVEVRGRELTRDIGSCVYVSNHLSMVDILAVFALRRPFLWVSKIENFHVPFLGWNMWLNKYIPLKRGYLPSIMRMMRLCIRRLGEGHALFVFPEGTRSPDGELQSFHAGAFRIAARNRVPIVPVVLEGSNRVLRKHSLLIRPQRVILQVLAPVHPDHVGGDWRRLQTTVRTEMQAALAAIRQDAAR